MNVLPFFLRFLCIVGVGTWSSTSLVPDIQNDESIPHGAASLAFVFDITGSMYDDLVQVIEGAAKILAATLARREKPLYNYVLVPFHDPEVGPVTVTTDPDKFQRDLRDLYVQGGGDCPEMSITAIKMALQQSLPNSFIYVFTDARAKDYSLTEQVLTLIQHKQSQVVFVMTGDCGDTSHPGYKAYEQIASTSSGQIFLLKKSQVNQVLNFVRVAVQSRKVNLLSMDRSARQDVLVYELPVDSKLKEFTISVSGEKAEVVITDPTGKVLTSKNGLNTLLRLRNALILNVKDPKPGNWLLKISAQGQHTVRITGLSSLDFVHGFSSRSTLQLGETDARPMKGIPTYLLINATDLTFPGRINKLELVNLRGDILMEIPIQYYASRPFLYNVSSFIPPQDFYYLKVVGIDNEGFDFQRTTPTAISPIEPEVPRVFMPRDTRGFYEETAILTCYVTSAVPFAVQWFRDGEQLGNRLFYTESANVTWSIPDASSFSEGHYTCNATNAAGWNAATTYFDVKDPPPNIVKPLDVSVLPGHDAVLTCVASSTVDFNMTWFRRESPGAENTPLGPKEEILSNGSAIIRNVSLIDEGIYVCRASNEGGYNEEIVWLIVHKQPKVSTSPAIQSFVVGSKVDILCSAVSYPKPIFVWKRNGEDIDTSNRVTYDTEGRLVISEAVKEDAGEWECIATNPLGVGHASATLELMELPTIHVPHSTVLVNSGDTASLVCEASGIPQPNITWYRGGIELQELSFMRMSPEGELTIIGTQEVDSGEYECVATNEAGSTTEVVTLEVGSAPVITKQPQNRGVDIQKNITLPCSAIGKPLPKITWSRTDGKRIDFDSGRIRVLETGALFMQNVQKEDEGMYTCTVSNQFGKQESAAFVAVTGIVKPVIAYTSPNIETLEGRDVKLTCIVLLGNPMPKIMWLNMGEPVKSNDRVTDDGNGNLLLKKVKVEDEGEYVCVATNPGGNATHVTKLDVQVPPHILDSATDITVTEGNSVRLPCEVTGDPRPQISWTKNGNRLSEADPHYFISASGSLEIFNADPQDTASYICTAINIAGVKERRITLFVQIPPVMIEDNFEFTVIVNNPVQLPCEVTGVPPPDIVWKKAGDDIVDNPENDIVFLPNGAMRINHVRVEDGGTYECIATSVAGSASKMITLNVQVPPQLESKAPTSIVAMAGEEVVLPCEVTGDPRPEVEWKKDSFKIDFFNMEHKYFTKGLGSLVIPKVDIRDTARYLCIAENAAGVVTQEINLIVHEPPTIPEDAETEFDIIANNRITLPCSAKGTPAPKIKWYKDDEIITGNEAGMKISPDGSLQIENPRGTNAGRYKCVAENVAGSVSHYINLQVYLPPRFGEDDDYEDETDQPTESMQVIQNETVRMFCSVHAIPTPQITWYKNGEEVIEEYLENRVKILNSGQELEISSSDIDDTARYTCVARNLAGETEKNFDLEVFVPPTIDDETATKLNISVIASRPVSIECPAFGVPLPDIVWFKDGQEIYPEHNHDLQILGNGRRLEISSADIADTGRYKCVAKNSAGMIEREYNLHVWIPARIDSSDTISNPEVIVNQTIILHCPASGVPEPDVEWFRDDEPVDEDIHDIKILDKGWRLKIKNAEMSHTGRYTCVAKNIAGESEKIYDLNVLVVPYIERADVVLSPKVIINKTVVINCPAGGIPLPEIVWQKNGENLDPVLHPNIQVMSGGRQLRITSAAISDSGRYRCIATNKAGNDNLDFQLSVHIPVSIDRSKLDHYPTVIVNQSKILECPVIGIPPPKITWFMNSEPIEFDNMPHISLRNEGRKLEIISAQVSDIGLYECLVENEAGTDQVSYDLKVFVPPTINLLTSTTSNPDIIIGQTVVINCHVDGVSQPRIQWLHNGQPLDESSSRLRILDDGQQLEIFQTEVEDAGRYTCIAKNEAGIVDRDFDLNVLVPPTIDTTNLELRPKVIKGKVITLNCPVQGIPFPNITWLKDDDPVIESEKIRYLLTGRQLEISIAEESDSAKYTCSATNIAGQAREDFDLSVLVPPAIDEANIVDSPKIVINRTVLLECPVAGIPPPKVIWMKNNEEFVPEEHGIQLVAGGRNLEISRAQVTDTARYTCIATNEAGELRRNFDLEVLVPATILGEGTVENIDVIENHTAYILCPADGIPAPSILWLKDNVPLLDFPYTNIRELGSGRQLEMRNVQVGDEGTYKCQATNVAGQKSKSFKLRVLIPPRIPGSRTESDVDVVVRRAIRLECNPTGTPEPEITWFKDGNMLDGEANSLSLRVLRGGRILQIVSAETSDAGQYTCNAQNIAGQEQKKYKVQVQVPPSINNSHLIEELSVVIGNTIEMDCRASGIPDPNLRWIREGELFTFVSHPNLRIQNGGQTLQVLNAQLPDTGAYTCFASNEAGNATKDFLLNVLVPPSIEDGPTEVAATVDTRTMLLCDTLGLPRPEVTWEKNDKIIPISGPGYMMHRTGSLQFSAVQVEDSGMYRCVAKNSAGTVYRDIQLSVQVPPKIEHLGPLHLKAILGSSTELPCKTTGVPKPRIVWQKGTKVMSDVQGYKLLDSGSLKIETVDIKDAGIYICVAQNNAGTALGQIRLEVQVPPSIEPAHSEYKIVQDRELVLPCRANGIPTPQIKWEKDGHAISQDDLRYRTLRSGWLAIAIARVEDAGRFTCVAENAAGKASVDMQVVVFVPPVIEESERVLTVTEGESARLPCVAIGFPPPLISWIQDGRSMILNGGRYAIHESGTLLISGVKSTDSGSYVCTAKNNAGRDSKEVQLKVQVPPTFTVLPRDLEIMANGRIDLECVAEGVPTPIISWKVNNTDFQTVRQTMRKNRLYKVTRSVNGRSKLIIDDALKRDDGTYMCVAENPAGNRRAVAAVRVKVPPKVLIQSGNQAVSLSERVLLHCPIDGGDPPPTIIWTKNDQPVEINSRVHQLENGSLAIYDSSNDDAGEYKCVATNDAGSSEGIAYLTVKVPPQFKIEPGSMTAEQGHIAILDCVAEGEPTPQMTWRKGKKVLQNEDRISILANNSLRIVAAQLSDSGMYICMARNSLGSVLVSANLTVQVHGQYSTWTSWSDCSVSCGEGSRSRTRTCTNPEPANGGRSCGGPAKESKLCIPQSCPVDGGWNEWSEWEECSQTCGSGHKIRMRDCNNPSPAHGGKRCSGEATEKLKCNVRPCPVDGVWGEWTDWRECSETCGEGLQERFRRCDSPRPEYGGRECTGGETDRRACKITDCEVNGNWGSWTDWSSCTLSCGGGTRNRKRKCDSPAPSRDGRFCPGSDLQIDYCNKEDCPVHGNWAEWSLWGDCTMTCGGGQRRRFRTCSNPMPKHNGRTCIGPGQETDACNSQKCAVDGEWSSWSHWSECSKSCDGGMQERQRTCRQPLFGGSSCPGDGTQMKKCNIHPCKANMPHSAIANVIGNINNREFGVAKIFANISRTGSGTRVSGTFVDVPVQIGRHLQPLVSILTPIYWTTAIEVGKAVNGYTLTQGNFRREVQVEFATGEILKMTHVARGIDADGVLNVDVIMSGEVPVLPDHANIVVLPYTEDYIQTGPGSIYAHSSRLFRIDGHSLPYAWNHTISYDNDYGQMPFLVERLTADDVHLEFDVSKEVLQYQLTASIAKGEPSNQCPTGFFLDPEGPYCKDDDECARLSPCSHQCTNNMGSFTCGCPVGYMLDSNGRICTDINECEVHLSKCLSGQQCINSLGSYRCVQTCEDGFRRSPITQNCEDINECQESSMICDHECTNMMGTYQCSCRTGFKLVGKSRCEDVNECESRLHRCSHECQNTLGSYRCTCPGGFKMTSEFTCTDVDECLDGSHNCHSGQECQNKPGGFTCVNTCPLGFNKVGNGSCVDIDECATGVSECKFNQVCKNTPGGYSCTCPRGFRSAGINQPCKDINECQEHVSPCSFKCQNTQGGYQCICPAGQKLLADKKSCAGLQYLEQPRVSPTKCPFKAAGRPCPVVDPSQMCPRGYTQSNGQCIDIDECQRQSRCQHGCQNTPGSFHCTCPPGYKLSPNRRTCQDIDECVEQRISCGPNQRCFNKRGEYECIDITCPPEYERDSVTGYCVLKCLRPGDCPPGTNYKDILEFHLVALPSGIPAHRDLIRLLAYDQENVHLPQTTFKIIENDKKIPFAIRLEDGKGVVYTLQPLREKHLYRMKVEARSHDHRRRGVQYHTTFMIFISVSSFPY